MVEKQTILAEPGARLDILFKKVAKVTNELADQGHVVTTIKIEPGKNVEITIIPKVEWRE